MAQMEGLERTEARQRGEFAAVVHIAEFPAANRIPHRARQRQAAQAAERPQTGQVPRMHQGSGQIDAPQLERALRQVPQVPDFARAAVDPDRASQRQRPGGHLALRGIRGRQADRGSQQHRR